MASRLELWARAEVRSPSGDDITAMILEKLDARLEGVNDALKEIDDA